MCHDIEDPTFDATAIATNPRAQVRPVHRPPRVPADRHPHCRVDRHHRRLLPGVADPLRGGCDGRHPRRVSVVLSDIDPGEPGRRDYRGALLSDIAFGDWSRSALLRIAEEVCIQGHMLTLSFLRSVGARTSEAEALAIGRHQFCGIAGLAAATARPVRPRP